MTDLQDFRDKMSNYKSYREQNPGKTYLDWKKAIQELKHIDIDNDPTYDYKGYYDLNNFAAQDMLNKKSDAHFTDNFKTSQHPTFSEESGYSGYINKFNPNGITGGSWGDHSYNLSDSQMANDWDIKNTLDYLSIAENEGISLKYDDKYPVIDDTVIGGVLPEVEVKGYADGGQIPLLGNKAKLFTQQDLNTMHDLNINAGAYDQPTSEVQHRIDSKGKVKTVPTPGNGFVSNNDPVGQFVVEGVATAPLFNLIGKAALFSAGRMGNKWARSKIISNTIDNSYIKPGKLDTNVDWFPKQTLEGTHTINKNPYITYPTEEYWNDKIKLARDKLYKQSMIDFNNNRELPINIKRKAVKLMDSFIDSDDYSNRLMNSYVDSNVRNIIKNNYHNDNIYGFFPAKYTNDFSFLNSNAPKGATNDIIDGQASQEGIVMNADYVNKKSNSEFYSNLLHELAHYSTKLERPALTDEERLLYALYDKTEDGLTLRTLMDYNESIAKNKSLEDILKSNGVTDLSKAEEFLNKKNRGVANRHMLEYLKDPQEKRARAVTTWLKAKKRNISTDQLVDMYTDINGNITKKAPSELRQLGVILDKENLKKYLNKFLFTTAVGKTLKYPQNNNKRQYE